MPKSSLLWKAAIIITICYVLLRHLTPNHSVPSSFERASSSDVPIIPLKFWQTWHTPQDQLNGTIIEERVQTWLTHNPQLRHELLTDDAAASFVNETYLSSETESRAEDQALSHIGNVFLALPDPILRADFLRYLMIYAHGGYYADMDVSCLAPIHKWASADLLAKAKIIVGIENDRHPVENDWKLYKDYRKHIWGLNNWTFAAKAGHPLLRAVVEKVAHNLEELAKSKGVASVADLKDVRYKEVIDATGPGAFTQAFLDWKKQHGHGAGYDELKMIEHPVLVGGEVLVLPIRAMSVLEANRPDGEGARSLEYGEPVIRHWSAGTWKTTHLYEPGTKPKDWQG